MAVPALARQMHRTPEAAARSAMGRLVALQRARAVEASGLRFAPGAAAGFAVVKDDVHIGPAAKDTSLPTASTR